MAYTKTLSQAALKNRLQTILESKPLEIEAPLEMNNVQRYVDNSYLPNESSPFKSILKTIP